MRGGVLKLFRVAGIQVYLHFTWFIVAVIEIQMFARRYQSPGWAVAEYLSLFLIVLLHEFGHAFACRSVGGKADHIILWPLGGIAFVEPPPRPGAYLWSIAAGPLVNVVLFPVLTIVTVAARSAGLGAENPDMYRFLTSIWYINTGLLIFNILPVYPLDGGQIVRALLWFVVGPIRSLKIASVIGFIGAACFAMIAFSRGSIWLGILAFFVFERALIGWKQANLMADLEKRAQQPVNPAEPPPLPPAPLP